MSCICMISRINIKLTSIKPNKITRNQLRTHLKAKGNSIIPGGLGPLRANNNNMCLTPFGRV